MLSAYSTQYFSFHPVFVVDHLYSNDVVVSLEEVTAQIFAQIAYYWNDYLCLNLGYALGAVDATLTSAVTF
jgi:hypothetical protein